LIALTKDAKSAQNEGLRHDLEKPESIAARAKAANAAAETKRGKEKEAAEVDYIRRVYLDTTGTVPTPEDVKKILADPDPNRRAKLADTLISNRYYAQPLEPERLFFAPDGKRIAVARGPQVELLDAATGKVLVRFVVPARINSIAFSPAGD